MSWLLTLLLALPGLDPRISLAELQIEQQHERALEVVDRALAEDREFGDSVGLDYLRGHLLTDLRRPYDAVEAYARVLSATPKLAPYSRLRIALIQEDVGHPEVAAGLAASLLASDPPEAVISPATALLQRSLERGGDCRVLGGVELAEMPASDRRRLQLARAGCAQLSGQSELARSLLLELLEETHEDSAAREAAERMAVLPASGDKEKLYALLGVTFHRHREFERSAHYLQKVVISLSSEPRQRESFETLYQLSRSHFWQGQYLLAAEGFEELAGEAREDEERALARYQEGRSYELLGDWQSASDSFRQAYLANPNGNWAGPALLSALRLEWRVGREEAADELLPLLKSRYRWRNELARAAMFLAVSEIVRGRHERPHAWLLEAERSGRVQAVELDYWRGRLAELEQIPQAAVRFYVRALRRDPFHPLAQVARQRLAAETLADQARSDGRRLATSLRWDSQLSAWLLLGDGDPDGRAARQRLEQQLQADRIARPFLTLAMVPAAQWTLWGARLERPEEMLLALGVWSEGGSAVLQHFPVSQPALAFTASRLLAQAGETKRSLYIAEILGKRVPQRVPPQLLPEAYRQLVYPLPYRELLQREGRRHAMDPYLLAALIREESRFDPAAVSVASARGLTQFVFSTARRLARETDLGEISPRDLDRPEITIALGAAYLAELRRRYRGLLYPAIAAYNAGEAQAQVWLSHCYSRSADEYYSKVGFPETRSYLARVLASRAQYQELYGNPPAAP